jgi:hypothetical protein
VTDRRKTRARLLAVWNGDEALDELRSPVSPNYRGPTGCAIATSHSSDKTSPTIETAHPACASTSSTNSATALT